MSDQQTRSQILYDKLAKIISNTQPGERLLTEPELAKQLGVSRATLREAMRAFETQGMIRRRQGSGTYVTHPSHVIESGLEVLESIDTLSKRIGLQTHVGDLQITRSEASPEEADNLKLQPGAPITRISRIILAEERPVAYLVDVIPADVLSADDLNENFTGSVLDMLLMQSNLRLESSRTEINAVTATTDVARLLGIQRGDVLLRFIAYLYTAEGRVVDHSFSYFLPGYFHFHVVRRVGRQ
jgi:GntR family transcriptional regulator